MTKIIKLTAAQEARLVEFRDEYLRRGLSTKPADREEAEAAVRDAYRAGGLVPPATIIWLPSPMAGAIGAAMLSNKVGDQALCSSWLFPFSLKQPIGSGVLHERTCKP